MKTDLLFSTNEIKGETHFINFVTGRLPIVKTVGEQVLTATPYISHGTTIRARKQAGYFAVEKTKKGHRYAVAPSRAVMLSLCPASILSSPWRRRFSVC